MSDRAFWFLLAWLVLQVAALHLSVHLVRGWPWFESLLLKLRIWWHWRKAVQRKKDSR